MASTDLAQRHALAIDLLLHAGRLAGLAETVQRAKGRELLSPLTWLQAAQADLRDQGFAPAHELRAAMPHAAAAFDEGVLANTRRASHCCSLFATAADIGVEGIAALEPRPVKRRVKAYEETVAKVRALPTQRRKPTTRTEAEIEAEGHQLAMALAENARDAKLDQRLHRDAAHAVHTVSADAELDSAAATQLRTTLHVLAHGSAPMLDLAGLPLLGIEEPLPDDPRQPTAILIAIDLKRDPYRAAIVRSNSKLSELAVGRILTGEDAEAIRAWVEVGRRVYVARAGHEYEAGATCADHPWGRTRAVTQAVDQQTGRVVSTTHGGDSLYTWAERHARLGKGSPPNAEAMAIYRATNACPICALPSGPQITSDSRDAVDAYDRLRLAARGAYFAAKKAWPNQRGQTRDEALVVERDGVPGHLGPRPEPVLEGVAYRIVHDLQRDYVERAEALWTYKGWRQPATPDETRKKWGWIKRQPGFGERPRDRFTVAQVTPQDDELPPRETYCVGEPEREAENAAQQAAIDIAHRNAT